MGRNSAQLTYTFDSSQEPTDARPRHHLGNPQCRLDTGAWTCRHGARPDGCAGPDVEAPGGSEMTGAMMRAFPAILIAALLASGSAVGEPLLSQGIGSATCAKLA